MKLCLPKKLLAILISVGLLAFNVVPVQAATFSLSPTSGSTVSGTFTVTLNLADLSSKQTSGIDVWLNYEPSKLEAQQVTTSEGIFSTYITPQIDASTGKIKIFASAAALAPVTQNGIIATITFKALQTSGSTTISFDYTAGSTIDSNITEAGTETDLLTQPPTVTYNFSTSTTTDTTTTTTPPPAGNGAAKGAPDGGITEPTVLVSFLSMSMVGVGLALRIKKRTALSFEEKILSQN